MVLSLGLASCGSSKLGKAPAQSVDLGIRVVSGMSLTGVVTTLAIGRADDADFMAAHPTAKPLYFATGNLFVDEDSGTGRIGTAAESGSGLNYGLFGWADVTDTMTSIDKLDYPFDNVAKDISGNPKYDIAHAKLGEKWRLPTAKEWCFLMKYAVKGATADRTRSSNDHEEGQHTLWQSSPAGITLTSSVAGFTENSIFLPAAGRRSGSNAPNFSGSIGYYWSGAWYGADFSNALYFHTGHWFVYMNERASGFSVRPVSE